MLGRKFYVQEGEDNIDRAAKTDDACGRRFEEEVAAKGRLKLAQRGMEAAQSDDFGETIKRATLIKGRPGRGPIRIQLEKETKSKEKVELKGRVLGALGWIPAARQRTEQHQVLLEWINSSVVRWRATVPAPRKIMMIVACQSKPLQQRFETTLQLEHQDGIGPQKRMVTNGND